MQFLVRMLFVGWLATIVWATPGSWAEESSTVPNGEARLLSNVRQLTFEGRRAGEGYFSRDGSQMVFQSERIDGNPFFQIFVMDLQTGDVEQISPGHGKTTCAWIHPDGDQILYASTHNDAEARNKQAAELADRAAGTQRRYAWDYDDEFELYSYDRATKQNTRLTDIKGYDAEASWSPNGKWIAFASNRAAYSEPLSDEDQETLERDKSFFNEIYMMRSDGTQLRRLTHADGYDGGPFFSPDGNRLCWRRFSEDGATAEIMTMKIDGSDQRQLTRMGAMSWAPFYHPSGEYLIFTTNKHGFSNFELYLVDQDAKSLPVRVTDTDGFDGLPAFTPDGQRLAWTTNRNADKQSQIYIADWDHEEALRLLAISSAANVTADAEQVAASSAAQSSEDFLANDLLRHVDYLCRPELEGRLTGTEGEKKATAYVAAYMDSLGLLPAGDDGGWFQEFEFTSGIALGANNHLVMGSESYRLDEQWRPLAFSGNGEFVAAPVAFVGYGIAAPEDKDAEVSQADYDSFVHFDVAGKWVMCLRFMPEDIPPERRQHLARYSSLRFKAMHARDLGAAGLIVVSGPTSQVKNQLVPLKSDGSLTGSSIPIICVTDEVAQSWLAAAGKDLAKIQQALDSGEPMMSFDLPQIDVAATIELEAIKATGRNVLGMLQAGTSPAEQMVVVGAHIDHLGRGTGGSLARGEEVNQIHFGADDNASGVAAMLEIAQYLVAAQAKGKFPAQRDVLFAAWSGEELGLLGASHFVNTFGSADVHAHVHQPSSDAHDTTVQDSIYPKIAACLNLDMVGRFEKRLVLQGVGSSSAWKTEIERRNAPVGLPITLQNDSYLPTDASAFFMRGVPILAAFTGSHSEYHTPRDTPDKLNYDDAARIAKFMALVTRGVAMAENPPDYIQQARPEEERPRAGLRAYLGTIPDYAQSEIEGAKGVLLSGVAKDGPASKAGVQGGDRVVKLAGKNVENIYDYTYAIDALKIGQTVEVVVQRGDKKISLQVTPGSRE